jgi:hypothetical protein
VRYFISVRARSRSCCWHLHGGTLVLECSSHELGCPVDDSTMSLNYVMVLLRTHAHAPLGAPGTCVWHLGPICPASHFRRSYLPRLTVSSVLCAPPHTFVGPICPASHFRFATSHFFHPRLSPTPCIPLHAQEESTALAKPNVTGCDVDLMLKGPDLVPLVSDEASLRQIAQHASGGGACTVHPCTHAACTAGRSIC